MTMVGAPIRLDDGPTRATEEWAHAERAYFSEIFGTKVITNVAQPTLTPVRPARGNGTGVIVAPGGGFHALSIDSEGFDVAHWLAARDVTAFVLQYRLVPSGEDAVAELAVKTASDPELASRDMDRIAPLAAADAEAAVRLVRSRADEFGVVADRVGCVGFSAGGNVAIRLAYTADDDARPDFLAAIYPTVTGIDLADPPAGSGPMFVVAATDDELGLAADAIRIYERWRVSGLPVELHLYERGGHGFGMRAQGLPSDAWIERFGDWLVAARLMDRRPA